MPVQQRVAGLVPSCVGGTYRLKVVIPTETGEQTVTSAPFTVQ